ncbi:hypothetical protein WR25_03731 [Diploscapter pachys]|uniref:Uncharacterized protein n=1 Tax=Diploscapter pachys TaxID=2018661 RepID=A0A2A2LN94_9BILA|nr:hypothetical protein WR25_03731 [Diploscapter pachys]
MDKAVINDRMHSFDPNNAVKEGNVTKVPLNETASAELMDHWLQQAVLTQLDEDDQDELAECSKNAHIVPAHAKCIVKVMDKTEYRPVKIGKMDEQKFAQKKVKKSVKHKSSPKKSLQWTGSFGVARAKRSADNKMKIHSRESYALGSHSDDTILTKVARSMTKTIRAFKEKEERGDGWRKTIVRIKEIGKQAKEEDRQREKMKERLRQMIRNTPPKYGDPRKTIALQQMEDEEGQLSKKKLEAKKKSEAVRIPLKLMRDAVKVNLLSPSLFSLHDDGEGIEKELSLPHILNQLKIKDQEAWLDFIVEASGVTDAADKMEKKIRDQKEKRLKDESGMPLYFTKKNLTDDIRDEETMRKVQVFEHLDKTYTPQQVYGKGSPYKLENKRLSRMKRLRRLHDDPEHLIEHDIRALAEAEKFHSSARKDIVLSPIVSTNLLFASATLSNTFIVLSPLVFSPIVLSPAVSGPIILSPWVFIPLILSPRVMGPLILSPMIFSPLILSPLVLHPLILTPGKSISFNCSKYDLTLINLGIFNPAILNPFLLSPLILSPQVFTPIILRFDIPYDNIREQHHGQLGGCQSADSAVRCNSILTMLRTIFIHLLLIVLCNAELTTKNQNQSVVTSTSSTAQPPLNSSTTVHQSNNGTTAAGKSNIQNLLNKTLDQMTLEDVKKSKYYKDGRIDIPIKDSDGEALHEHWIQQAFSGLMAAIATRKMKYMEDYEKEAHQKCAKEADDMELHAKCLVQLMEADSKHRWLRRWKYFSKQARKQFSSEGRRLSKESRSSQETVKVGSFSQELSSEERIASRRRQKAYISAEKLRMKESRQLARRRMMHSSRELSSSAESRLRPGAFRVITLKKTDLPRTLTTTTTVINAASSTRSSDSTTPQPASSRQMRATSSPEQRREYAIHSYTKYHHHYNLEGKKQNEWIGSFKMARAKRAIVNKGSYELMSQYDTSPFNIIARHLTKTVRIIKGKNGTKSWQETLNEIRQKGAEMKKTKEASEAMKRRMAVYANAAQRFSKNIEKAKQKPVTIKRNRPLAMPELDELEEVIEDESVREMIRKKAENMTDEEQMMQLPVKLIKEAIKLGMQSQGLDTTNFNKMNLKVASPRFMSVVPEDEGERNKSINLLSPSLFALHSDGSGIEKQTSLTSLIKGLAGDKSNTKQDWLDFVVEATGVAEAVDEAKDEVAKKEYLTHKDFIGEDGRPLYFTKENVTKIYGKKEARKIEIMEKLEKLYNPEQLKELNRTGYAILTVRQREILYGPGSTYHNETKLQQLKNVSDSQVHRTVHSVIRSIAKGELKVDVRQHDIVLSPIVNAPLIFAPGKEFVEMDDNLALTRP